MRGALASSKSSVIALLCRPELIIETAVTELRHVNAMGVTASQGIGGLVVALNYQKQGRCGFHNGQQSQPSNQITLTCADQWHWVVDHVASRNESDKKPTKFLFIL